MSRPHIVGNSLKVTTIAFSQLFRDLKVYNYNEQGEPTLEIPVHVSLDTKESIYEYLKYGGSHEKIKQKDTMLPRIGIQITSMNPAIERQTGKNQTRVLYKKFSEDAFAERRIEEIQKDIQPVPFNVTYTVSVWCKYLDHWAQIQENILPFFDPYTTVGVRERELGIERQIRTRLESVTPTNSFEIGQGNQQRIIRSEMDFTCETVLYKQMNKSTTGTIDNVWITMVDVETPFSSMTININSVPTDTLTTSGSP